LDGTVFRVLGREKGKFCQNQKRGEHLEGWHITKGNRLPRRVRKKDASRDKKPPHNLHQSAFLQLREKKKTGGFA